MSVADGPLADWLKDISPGGRKRGFLRKFSTHSLAFVDNGPRQLVMTFDNLAELNDRSLMRSPWSYDFFASRGCSVLGLMARRGIWYRDAELISYLQAMSSGGFFSAFDRVLLTGNSMGGFGCLAFAPLIPGADILSFSPQTTLDKAKVPWETRFEKAWAADWTLPYSDASEGLAKAGQVNVIYDPVFELDRLHADRITGPNVQKLKSWYASHKSPVFLRRIEALKPVTEAALAGELTAPLFYDLYRGRKATKWYRNTLGARAKAQGHPGLAKRVAALSAQMSAGEKEKTDAHWMQMGRRLAQASGDQGSVAAKSATRADQVLVFASAADDSVITRLWLAYHAQFFASQNITILHEGGKWDLGCQQMLTPKERQTQRLHDLLGDAKALGHTAVVLSTDEFLVIDPEIGTNPVQHMLDQDNRPHIAPFGVNLVHNRRLGATPIDPALGLLNQRPYFRFSSTTTRPVFFRPDAADTPCPPHISGEVLLFNAARIDHDRACLNAALAPGDDTPSAISTHLDRLSNLTPSEREPVGQRLIARLYGNWARAMHDAEPDQPSAPHPLTFRNRLFELPKRYHSLF